MSRQALDAAEGQKRQQEATAAAVAKETTSLGLGSGAEGPRIMRMKEAGMKLLSPWSCSLQRRDACVARSR
jgi:hypothetical protein